MSATYNWAYKPGVSNKYNIVIPAGDDTVRPAGFAYVALYGNDESGNGSRQLPFRTLTKGVTALSPSGGTLIIGSGTYREVIGVTANVINLIGDGDVLIDYSYYVNIYFYTPVIGAIYHVKFLGC